MLGANRFAVEFAGMLKGRDVPVLLVDSNLVLCEQAREAGLSVVERDGLDPALLEDRETSDLGLFLAMTERIRRSAHGLACFCPSGSGVEPHGW